MIAKQTGRRVAAVAVAVLATGLPPAYLSAQAPARPPAAGGGAAPPARPAATAAPAEEKAEKTRRSVEVLVARGLDAVSAGAFKAARDSFADALTLDPRDRRALEGAGYSYLKLNDIQRAKDAMEGAIAVPTEPAGRALSVNLAVTLLRTRNAVRATKVLRAYLESNSAVTDELAFNAFVVSLGQTSPEAKVNAVFADNVKFFERYQAKLEATKPGMRRWGVEWISQREWTKKDEHNQHLRREMDARSPALEKAKKDFYVADAAYDHARRQKLNRPDLRPLQARAVKAKEKAERLQKEYDAIAARVERPTLPTTFEPVPLEEAAIAVASANVPRSPGDVPDPPVPGATTVRPPAAPPVLVRPNPGTSAGPAPTPPTPPPVAVAPPPADPVDPPAAGQRQRSVFTSAAAFAVAPTLLVTSAEAVDGAGRISVQPSGGDQVEAEVVKTDAKSGLALIRLKAGRMTFLPVADAYAAGPVQCVGFPDVAVFDPAADLIAGSAGPAKDDGWTVRLARHPRVAGSPILAGGKVVGVELASRDHEPAQLPAATLAELKELLAGHALPNGTAADPKAAAAMVSGVRSR